MKLLKVLLLLIVLIVIGGVLLLGYFGFVPGVSALFGSNKPRDLGITYTEADLASANAKTGVTQEAGTDLPEGMTLSFSDETVAINKAFTDEEISAMFNNCQWKYCLFTDMQVKIADDGTVEMSGILRTDRAEGFAKAFGYTDADVAEAKKYVGILSNINPPFYAKGTASVVNGEVSLDVQSTEIGRIGLPQSFIKENDGVAEAFIETQIQKIPGFTVSSATFADGQFDFSGTFPQTMTELR